MNAPFKPPFEPGEGRGIEYPPKTLGALRALEPEAVRWSNLEWQFIAAMVNASFDRRMSVGTKGLMRDAARTVVMLAMRDVAKARLAKGTLLLWDGEMVAPLIAELETAMRVSAKLKAETKVALKELCRLMWTEGGIAKNIPNLQQPTKDEVALDILTRTLDYIEHMGDRPEYSSLAGLRRACCSCLRVINAVFDCAY